MFLALNCAVLWCVIIGYLTNSKQTDSKKEVLVWTFPATVLTAIIINSDSFSPTLDFWNLNKNIQTYGTALSLIAELRQMKVSLPPQYSYEEVQRIYNEYMISDDEKVTDTKPHIIVVMNEAFSDLNIIDPMLDKHTYLPNYCSLSNNVIKGQMLASTYGGGTANTEYEFLTGNSIGFIPGTIPYQQFVLQSSPSLVKVLKKRGYRTVAIHPYDKSGYGRDRVYPFLGFDEFLDINSFDSDLPLIRERYVSDADSYHKVIETFEKIAEQNNPAFIFNVTMQNHGDYLSGYYEDKKGKIQVPGYEGEFPDVEEYLTLLKESDAAFPILTNYFSRIKEPVILIMFGDHQPSITHVN